MNLTVLPGELSVWRLDPGAPLPELEAQSFLSMTRTEDELSIVTSTSDVIPGAVVETGWRCIRVEGPLGFAMTGVLASLSKPLAEAGIPIFVVSTYDTDYLLVKSENLDRACSTLSAEGHSVNVETLDRSTFNVQR